MKICIGNFDIKYKDYVDDFREIADKNDCQSLLNKLDILVKYKDAIKKNVNVNLLIDSLIVSIGGIR